MTDDDMRIYTGQVVKAMALIVEHEKTNAEMTGVIKCPRCGGKLHYHSRNKDRSRRMGPWGKCETDGCLKWMA